MSCIRYIRGRLAGQGVTYHLKAHADATAVRIGVLDMTKTERGTFWRGGGRLTGDVRSAAGVLYRTTLAATIVRIAGRIRCADSRTKVAAVGSPANGKIRGIPVRAARYTKLKPLRSGMFKKALTRCVLRALGSHTCSRDLAQHL